VQSRRTPGVLWKVSRANKNLAFFGEDPNIIHVATQAVDAAKKGEPHVQCSSSDRQHRGACRKWENWQEQNVHILYST